MRQDGSPGSCGILLLFSGGIQMKNWVLLRKGGNFTKIGKRFHIHPRTAALIRNRDIIGEEAVDRYLNGTIADLYDGMLMKDMDKAVDLLKEKLTEGQSIRIIGDYDIDGVNATYILLEGLTGLGARVDYDIPDRIRDGYGLNIDLIDRALDDDIDTIITCDNGIAAKNEIAYGKSMGMSIIVTDHHEVPYEEKEDGTREFQIPPADAVEISHRVFLVSRSCLRLVVRRVLPYWHRSQVKSPMFIRLIQDMRLPYPMIKKALSTRLP